MFHYPNQIKLYGSVISFTIGIGKVIHITQIKNFFRQTNINKSYKKQILNHNIKKFNLIIKANLNMFSFIKTLIHINQNTTLQINSVSSIKKIREDLKQHFRKYKCQRLQYSCLSTNYQCLAETIANKANVLKLIDVLAVFIKQERTKIKAIESPLNKYFRNNNSI